MGDDLKRMADDWGYFCEVVWGRTLSDWQKDALQRLASNGSVMTRMTLKEGVSGASFDCIIVDDVYEKPVENGYAECVITKRLRDSCYLAFDDGENDYTTAPQAASRIEQLEETIEVMQYQIKELQWNLECKDDLHQQDYERLRHYQIALSDISKMTMCMAVSYADLAQKQKDIATAALGEKKDG